MADDELNRLFAGTPGVASDKWEVANPDNLLDDIHAGINYILNLRWVCVHCAYTTQSDPLARFGWLMRCPECNHAEWHQTGKPIDNATDL